MNAETEVDMTTASSSSFITQNRNENSAWCFGVEKKNSVTKSKKNHLSLSELTEELNELSVKQREKVFDDIHGVSKAHDETPEFVESCINMLNDELLIVPQKRRQAMDRAVFLKPSIASDVKFKLMFLRADNYDAPKAARRMSQYFADKLQLFGEDKLAKKITLDDLSEDDMKVMNSGFFVVLENKDSAGRTIWLCDLPKHDFEHPASMMRCTWYQIMSTLEDETAQLRGAVNISNCPPGWKPGVSLAKFAAAATWGGAIANNLPCVTSAHHYFSRGSGLEFIESVLRRAAGKHLRLHSRGHFGSVVETQYELMTFGIQFPDFLFTNSPCVAGLAKEYLEAYIQRRRVKDRRETELEEEQALASGVSLYPNPHDVLVGRGAPYQNFNGNKQLGRLIEESYLERYRKVTDRFEKTCIHMEVIKEIQDGGGRFLEKTPDGGWVVVEEAAARSKVWGAFRSKLAKQKSSSGASEDKSNIGGGGGGGSAKRMRYN